MFCDALHNEVIPFEGRPLALPWNRDDGNLCRSK
jgi:hypothetical protein